MQHPRIVAYLMTCPARAEVLDKTLTSFKATDWPEEPRIITDTSTVADPKTRMTATALRLMQDALSETWDYLLFLEDDVEFNKYLHHNLTNWLPVRYNFVTLATLYSAASSGMLAGQNFFVRLASDHGGSQALLLCRKLAEDVVASWNSFADEMQDLRIGGTASRINPMIYVFSPNLVQHRPQGSTWGGPAHASPTFDSDFKLSSLEGDKVVHVAFRHGLGDCAHAAHLFALYRSLGHSIVVDCDMDKALLFQAARCVVALNAPFGHPWDHAPAPDSPGLHDHYSGNKTAWNISKGGLPDIGSAAERWGDLCNVKLDLDGLVGDDARAEVAVYMSKLPRPIALLHTKGNTSQEAKNYPDELHNELYRAILDRIGGTLLILDWDSRVPWFSHYGLRHMEVDWKGHLTTAELYETIKSADCLVGVDSGVLHFARFTETPAVGIWKDHYPSHFALPRKDTVHIVGNRSPEWTRRRRLAFNILDVAGDIPSPADVADVVARMIRPRRYLAGSGPDVLMQHLIDKTRATTDASLHPFRDRHRTFGSFLGLLRAVGNPLVVETGCIRTEEDWSAGFSTYLFGVFLRYHGGELHSVDFDRGNVGFARTWTAGLPVTIHQSDSRSWLGAYQGRVIDGLYLDSADLGTPGYQEICLDEVRLALPHLAPSCPILVDDTPYAGGRFDGKGGLAVPWLMTQGYKIKLAGYQVLLTKEDT